MNYLSSNIKFLRQQRNLKQEDLANVVGKARSSVSLWESDDRGIATEDLIKLSEYFDVPMDELIGKDLRLKSEKEFDELDILFNKYKDILTKDDKDYMKFIINKRRQEIDEQLDGKDG